MLSWLAHSTIAAFVFAALELILISRKSPYVPHDAAGAFHLFVCLFALFGFWSAIGGVFLRQLQRIKIEWVPRDAALLWSGACAVLVAALGVGELQRAIDRVGIEHPEIIRSLELWSTVVLVAVALAGARLVVWPALKKLERRFPAVGSLRAAQVTCAAAAAGIGLHAAHEGFGPIYLPMLAAASGLGALGALILMVRAAYPAVSKSVLRGVLLALFAGFIAAPIGSCRNNVAAYALHNASFTGGPLIRAMETSLDLDADGTHPVIFGGADCEEGDPQIGGGIRELPGDGIDQDCRGGDAVVAGAPPDPVASAVLEGCEPLKTPLSILLITIDAFRADRMTPQVSRFLNEYAQRAIRFERAYSPSTITDVSLTSIFTGLPISKLGSPNLNVALKFDVRRHFVPGLAWKGYETGAYTSFNMPYELMSGFQPFPWYTDAVQQPLGVKNRSNSAVVSTNARAFLAAARARPFFLWLHYSDPHAPYVDPQLMPPKLRRLSPYEKEIAYADYHLGKLLGSLDESGTSTRTAVIITADHGEDLGDRGRVGHGRDVFEDSIHVPLLIYIPGCAPRVISEVVSLVDLAPTVGLLARIPFPGPTLFDETPRIAVAEACEGYYFNRAIVSQRYKLIDDVQNAGRLLFDLQEDPGETVDLTSARPEILAEMEASYQAWLDRAVSRSVSEVRTTSVAGAGPRERR